MATDQYKILFCCMGNICRSPSAEGVFRAAVDEAGLSGRVIIDSAGTHGYHVGEPPDTRSQRHAARRGYDLSRQRARQVEDADFARFDLIVAMDHDNLALLRAQCPSSHAHKLRLMMDFAPAAGIDVVPDPYYGGASGFERVLDLLEQASSGLLVEVRRQLNVLGEEGPARVR